ATYNRALRAISHHPAGKSLVTLTPNAPRLQCFLFGAIVPHAYFPGKGLTRATRAQIPRRQNRGIDKTATATRSATAGAARLKEDRKSQTRYSPQNNCRCRRADPCRT